MAKKKIKTDTDQRPFIMVYLDFLESKLLDNYYQKLVYIYLKKFANTKNQCYPSIKTIAKQSGISINKVKTTLIELEEKGIISKINRNRSDGGKSSNLYTLYDYQELWNTENNEEAIAAINQAEEKRMVKILTAKGYFVSKEKEPVSIPAKVTETSPNQPETYDNSTLLPHKSQDPTNIKERYTMKQVHQLFAYDTLIRDNSYQQQEIDAAIEILHTTLNTNKSTIRIAGQDRPAEAVISRLMKLSPEMIVYAINKFAGQKEKIQNPSAYMLSILYSVPEDFPLHIQNMYSSNT